MNFLIADDHAIVRKGLVGLLHEEFPEAHITEVANGADVYEHVKGKVWDVILLDISMPGRSGLEILKQLQAAGIKAPVLMLSMHPEDQYAVRVLKAGAAGYMNKESATEELIQAVHRIMAGRKYITASVAELLVGNTGHDSDKPLHDTLSDREMQVLQLIGKGNTVSEVADELSLSVNTISTYRSRILEKLHLNNNAELTRYAIENSLV